MFSHKPRTKMWHDNASSGSAMLWIWGIVAVLMAAILALTIISKDQPTHVSAILWTEEMPVIQAGNSTPFER